MSPAAAIQGKKTIKMQRDGWENSEKNGFQMGGDVHEEGDFFAVMESNWGCVHELERCREEHTPIKGTGKGQP